MSSGLTDCLPQEIPPVASELEMKALGMTVAAGQAGQVVMCSDLKCYMLSRRLNSHCNVYKSCSTVFGQTMVLSGQSSVLPAGQAVETGKAGATRAAGEPDQTCH